MSIIFIPNPFWVAQKAAQLAKRARETPTQTQRRKRIEEEANEYMQATRVHDLASLMRELRRGQWPFEQLEASLTNVTDWRGNKVTARFGDVLHYPTYFRLNASHANEIAQNVSLQQRIEEQKRHARRCRQCGGDVGEDEVGCACGPWTEEKNRVVNYYMTAFGDTRDEADARYERPPDEGQEPLVH